MSRPVKKPAALLAGLTLLAAHSVGAQQLGEYPFIEWAAGDLVATPTAADADLIATLRTAQDAYAVRHLEVELHFRANGDVEQYQRMVIDYADAAGIESEGNGIARVNSFSEQLSIEEAYVTTPDGRIIPVDPMTAQVLLEDDGGVFTNDHTVVIPFPSLSPGAAATLAYRVLTSGEHRAAPFSQLMFPQTGAPTGRFEVLVTWETGMEPPVVTTDSHVVECEEEIDSIRCRATGIDPAPADFDVNYYDVLGHVVVAEPARWSDLAALLGGYVANAWTDEAAVAAVVEEVTAEADTDRQKLEALHGFVAGQIRYVGIETGVNGVVPRDTGLTLERRYGDCKDKTALFLQMAEIAGLSASPVAVSSHRKNLDKLITPSMSYFDHMVACVELDDGETCIDLTDPYHPTRFAPSYLSDATALRLVAGAEDVIRLPARPAGWALNVDSRNVFEGGTVHETERREYGPSWSGLLRASLAGLNRAERERWAREGYEAVYGTDVPIELGFEGLASQQAPFVVETKASFENAVIPGDQLRYEHYPGWLADAVSQFSSTNEHFDYRFDGLVYRELTSFVVDEWELVATGAVIEFESRFGRMQRDYRYEEGSLIVETRLGLPARVIAVDEIDDFNQFLDTILDNSLIRFRARPRP